MNSDCAMFKINAPLLASKVHILATIYEIFIEKFLVI
jgi:hypothetical protein